MPHALFLRLHIAGIMLIRLNFYGYNLGDF